SRGTPRTERRAGRGLPRSLAAPAHSADHRARAPAQASHDRGVRRRAVRRQNGRSSLGNPARGPDRHIAGCPTARRTRSLPAAADTERFPMTTTRRTTHAATAGAKPPTRRKRFGQHFLAASWARRVVDAIAPAPGDVFL